jgi:DNA-binding NarL/FixJ family response regulator
MDEMEDLTPRQGEIARAAVSTLSNKELALKLGIAEGTLKIHLHVIYRRLDVEGRKGLIMKLQERRVA